MRGRAAGVRAKVEPPFEYGRIADLYDAWFHLIGLKRGVERFLERVDWRLPYTVKFHVASILARLGAGSRTEAVTLGFRHGCISL